MKLGLFKLITSGGNGGGALGVDQGPLGRQHRPESPPVRGRRAGRAVGPIGTGHARGEGGQGVGLQVEAGIPEGDLGPQIALGLVHLAGDRLEVGIIDFGEVFHLLQAQGPQLLDHHLPGLDRQGQGGRGRQIFQARGELGGGRGHQGGIDPGAIAAQFFVGVGAHGVWCQGQGRAHGLLLGSGYLQHHRSPQESQEA